MRAARRWLLLTIMVSLASVVQASESWGHFGQCAALLELARQNAANAHEEAMLADAATRARFVFIRVTIDDTKVPMDSTSPEAFHESLHKYLAAFDARNRKLSPDEKQQLNSDCAAEFM